MATESNNSMMVAIVAIIAVFVIAYFGLMFFNKQTAETTGGTTAGIDLNLGNTDGGNPPAPFDAQ